MCGARLRAGFGRKGLDGPAPAPDRRGPWGPAAFAAASDAATFAPAGPAAEAPIHLTRTDFLAAARANQRRTFVLLVFMVGLLYAVGYALGWAAEALVIDAEVAPGARGAIQRAERLAAAMAARMPSFFVPDPRLLAADDFAWVLFVSRYGMIAGLAASMVAVVWMLVVLWFGDRMVLGFSNAHLVTTAQEPVLHNVIEEMALAAGMPKPRVAVIESEVPNAFAFGMTPEKAVVGVTRGLLDGLDREELKGVVGHEMGHVANLDILYATVVGVIAGAIVFISDGVMRAVRHLRPGGGRGRGAGAAALLLFVLVVVFVVVAPFFARLVQMAVSRQREFLADATSVRLTRNPHGLIRALRKLADAAQPFDGANRATQHMFIVNPFRDFDETVSALMATHPPIECRIQRLTHLGDGG
jgi:heat shock protein HtpX